jgi:NADH-quinone oxidoreductase subunit L
MIFQFFRVQNPEVWFIQSWLKIGNLFSADLVLNLNSRVLFLAILNSFITFLIQVYSFSYLAKNENFGLYNTLISMFSAAMVWLFLAGNLFTLLLGWEWVGLVSYLLVQFWNVKERAIQAGLRVLLINKLGDIALISGLGLMVSFGLGPVLFQETVFPTGSEIFFHSKTGNVVCLFLVLAALVKSAQFPFNIWLKEAMEGPTAVSALLHSATMVVAGVWLLIQLSPILSDDVLWFLVVTGGFTMLMANWMAITSSHLKNVMAFSTMAQLGLMTLAIGLGKFDGALLHLVSHAFFKSSLFLVCGILMIQLSKAGFSGMETQYLANLKGILKNRPILKIPFLFSLAALSGWPLTAGFISKESIMPHVFSGTANFKDVFGFIILQLGILGTALYVTRIAIVICFKSVEKNEFSHKVSNLLSIPVLVLSFGAGFWLFGYNPFSNAGWLSNLLGTESHFVMPDFFALALGTFLGYRLSKSTDWSEIPVSKGLIGLFLELKPQVLLLQSGWKYLLQFGRFVSKVDQKVIDRTLDGGSKVVVIGGHFTNFADRKLIDGLISGFVLFIKFIGENLWEQTRKATQSVTFFIIFVLFLIIYFLN